MQATDVCDIAEEASCEREEKKLQRKHLRKAAAEAENRQSGGRRRRVGSGMVVSAECFKEGKEGRV